MTLQQWNDNGSEIDAPHQKMPSGLGVEECIDLHRNAIYIEREREIDQLY